MKRVARALAWAVGGIAVAAAGGFLAIVRPGGDGVLASLRTPDGSEYVVEQRCNWSMEPYTVSFYLRPPGGGWGWCYLDHEATRWSDVALRHDETADRVVVTERGEVRAVLDRGTKTFWIDNGDIRGAATAPQAERSPAFAHRRNP